MNVLMSDGFGEKSLKKFIIEEIETAKERTWLFVQDLKTN